MGRVIDVKTVSLRSAQSWKAAPALDKLNRYTMKWLKELTKNMTSVI